MRAGKGTELLNVATVPQLTLASPHPSGSIDTSNISPGLISAEESNSVLGLSEALDGVGNHEGNLWDTLDSVALSHHEARHSSGGDGRADGESLLGGVHLPVPPPPGLGGGEHAASSAHVAESSLARSVGSTSPDPGDPSLARS